MMNMIDENDRPTLYESIKTWEQQKTILQARKKVSMKATKNYSDRISFVLTILVSNLSLSPQLPSNKSAAPSGDE